MKKRRKKNVFKGFLLIIFFFLLFIKLPEHFIMRKLSSFSSDRVSIGSVSLKLPNLFIRRIKINIPLLSVFLKEVKIRPIFFRNAFAFSGPGEILLKEKKRDISIKGSFSGNFKNQTITVNKTNIEIGKIGRLEVDGVLENWGKDGFATRVNFKGLELEEIKQIFDLKLPFSGKVFGVANIISEDKEKTKEIVFDVNIKDLTTPEQDKFEASVKGAYNFLTEKTEISQGNLMSSDGGKISFKGVIDKEKFNLDFETKNMSVEEFLKLLPTELKEKYNLGIDRGSAKLKDFKIEIEKKNLNLMVSSPLIFPKLPFLTYNCIT